MEGWQSGLSGSMLASQAEALSSSLHARKKKNKTLSFGILNLMIKD
jgi:hypothetical protein